MNHSLRPSIFFHNRITHRCAERAAFWIVSALAVLIIFSLPHSKQRLEFKIAFAAGLAIGCIMEGLRIWTKFYPWKKPFLANKINRWFNSRFEARSKEALEILHNRVSDPTYFPIDVIVKPPGSLHRYGRWFAGRSDRKAVSADGRKFTIHFSHKWKSEFPARLYCLGDRPPRFWQIGGYNGYNYAVVPMSHFENNVKKLAS